MIFFIVFFCALIIQRVIELFIAKRNEKISKEKGGIEYDSAGYKYIIIMHAAFFISLAVEFIFFSRHLNSYWYIFLILFLLAQILRYWAISSLGYHWNTKIIIVPGEQLVSKGPYKYFKHPNYIVVITELAVIPLIFSCWFTSIVFTLLNLIVLRRRIAIEEKVLNTSSALKLKRGAQ